MWNCVACKEDIKSTTEFSHIKSRLHIENEVISRINNTLTDKKTYLNSYFDQLEILVERTTDGCKQNF